jgi:hypothetical protein
MKPVSRRQQKDRVGLLPFVVVGALTVALAACSSSGSSSSSSSGSSSGGSKPITITGGSGPMVRPSGRHSLSSLNVALFYDPTNNAYVEAR